jgi:hypothetical protein
MNRGIRLLALLLVLAGIATTVSACTFGVGA